MWLVQCVVSMINVLNVLNVLSVPALAGVVAPPWADVRRNPCAAQPRGWLMLYWPPENKCYTIYKKGHPCPETQELSPVSWAGRTIAECKCPPGSAQLSRSTMCHKLFQRGPCAFGEYFAPVEQSFNKRGERQGVCVRVPKCEDETLLYWPADGRCYFRYSQGPCYPGTILDKGAQGLAECLCNETSPHYADLGGGCYAHYTRATCEKGELFLPGGRCGCDAYLPHYHDDTGECYELDTPGPCQRGHLFTMPRESNPAVAGRGLRGHCTCKPFHARGSDGLCYRLYTRGPCGEKEMIVADGVCTKVPCSRGRLYVPSRRHCFPAGAGAPCPPGERLGFDLEARPTVDGLSHNGVCTGNREENISCLSKNGGVIYDGVCYIQNTRGPCEVGFWIVKNEKGESGCQRRPSTNEIEDPNLSSS